MKKICLAIVVPCYNEQEVLGKTAINLRGILVDLINKQKIDKSSFIYFIDDGSTDETWNIISALNTKDILFKGRKLAKNVGHQNALLAGLEGVKDSVDCAISIDADLQQDENVIIEFIEKYENGSDIVFGIRKDRSTDSMLKKFTALFFYKLMAMMGVNVIKNHADYRLQSKKVLEAIYQYKEVNLFLRGIFSEIGFKTDVVYFDVKSRFAGQSKYTLKKMLSFALNGITSFSVVPLRAIGLLGLALSCFSLFMIGYIFFAYFFASKVIPGWASIALPIYLIGGIQLLCLGVVGEYIAKIYKEVKGRPRYIVETEIG